MNQTPQSTNSLLSFLPIIVIWLTFILPPCWKILRKAGYSPWLSLLIFLPPINLILLWWFAFADWPILKGVNRPASLPLESDQLHRR
jgi:hypothetical protein